MLQRRNSAQRRFLIVGTFRSGSSALAEQLGLHPEVACGWESAGRYYFHYRSRVMSRVLEGDLSDLTPKEREFFNRTGSSTAAAIGFRLLFRSHHRWRIHPRLSPISVAEALHSCLAWLRRNPDVHIIQLVREQNLDWLTSQAFAQATGSYVGTPYETDSNVSMPIRLALRRLRMKHYIGEQLATLANTNAYTAVRYEDFRVAPERVIESLWHFLQLGVPDAPTATPEITVQRGTGNVLANVSELATALNRNNVVVDPTLKPTMNAASV